MTIGIDVRALQIGHQNRGIGMFVKSVLENLPKSNDRYVLYAFDSNDPINELGISLNIDYELVQTPTLNTAIGSPKDIFHFFKLYFHTFRRLKPFRPDVFVQFDFALGMPRWRRTKTVVIAYDLIPLIKKNQYMPSLRFAWQHSAGKKAKLRGTARAAYYQFKYRLGYRVYKRATSIVSISEATKKSFVDLLDIPANRIKTIHLAPVTSKTVESHKNTDRPYIFYIGGTDSRKRVADIVHAFNIVRGRGTDIDLVLAGNEFKDVHHLPDVVARNAILSSAYKNDIKLKGFVTDEEKMALYASAHAFIFCTSYEGFGLPVAEAMSAGCPVISYNNSSIPEAAGDAAMLVNTGDYVGVAHCILSLFDSPLRAKLIDKGKIQSKKFSWSSFAKDFYELLTN